MQKTGTRYSQITQYYRDLIERGMLREGDKMPTEEEVGRLFSVSRITVRQAMNELANAGYIVRMQGKGSYVSAKKTDLQLNYLQGFSEEMRAKGMVPSTKLTVCEIESATETIAHKLAIEPGTQVYSFERIRYANETPMAVEHVRIPFFLCPGLTNFDLSGSLYRILSEQYNLRPEYASQDIEAAAANATSAEQLGLKLGAPSLRISRVSYLPGGMPLEYALSIYRGDRYSFHVDMMRLDNSKG